MGGIARDTYQQLLRDVDIPVMCCLHVGFLALRYPGVAPETIYSIFAQENQYKVIKTHHVHKGNMQQYCSRYLCGEDILDLCAAVDFPPCLMIRRMLELLLVLSKQRVGDVLKNPALLQTLTDKHTALQEWLTTAAAAPPVPQQQQQQQYARQQKHHQQQPAYSSSSSQPSLSSVLHRLQVDIVRCVHADRSYSPYCDMAKSLAGLEHEALLCDHLQQQDIPFWSEEQLKARGLFKTPDALLQVPICVQHPASDSSSNSSSSWHVVHWIDSKACFGDDRTHSQQLEGQYRTYTNRYGPGLVIYWFGYVQGLESDADVLVMERFPQQQEIMQLPRLYAADNTTAAEQVVSASGAVAGVEVKVAGVADGSGADSRSTASASGSAAANALARRLSTLAC